jgi:CubicO group peptidase (beta-lactamase class C family)
MRRSAWPAAAFRTSGLSRLVAVALVVLSARAGGAAADTLLPAPVAVVPPLIDRAALDHALAALDGVVTRMMDRTGVPGVAVAVVADGEVVYLKGFGVREVGRPDAVGTDTVFQLASVSKPIASTIIARLVGEGRLRWTDPIRVFDPDFRLSVPHVSEEATFADMLSHRSGLSTGAGDLLEDLGFDRDTILARLREEPLTPFRAEYHYSNFGYTIAGVTAARASGTDWETLAETTLFEPLGMTRSSYRHADLLAEPDRARLHVRTGDPADRRWDALHDRNADAEAPAGGASASVADVARYLRLVLGNGGVDGAERIDAAALAATHTPQVISVSPSDPLARAGFYGFGWNVSYDEAGRVRIGHSGGFDLGAATNITLLPGEGIGIAVLTNGEPVGLAEAIGMAFFDIADHGRETVDWLGFAGGAFDAMRAAERATAASGEAPPDPVAARPDDAYVGTYANSYYGRLTVDRGADGLVFRLGPEDRIFALRHLDRDRFVFETAGENANGLSDATFEISDGEAATAVTLGFYNRNGLGTFLRE